MDTGVLSASVVAILAVGIYLALHQYPSFPATDKAAHSSIFPHKSIEMLEAEFASHKARHHPLDPCQTEYADPMRAQPLRKHHRLDRMCSVKEVEQSVLDPRRRLQRGA